MLGKLLLDQGAWMAVNLDGGGSTAMWVKQKDTYCESKPSVGGCLVNRPFGRFQQERVTRVRDRDPAVGRRRHPVGASLAARRSGVLPIALALLMVATLPSAASAVPIRFTDAGLDDVRTNLVGVPPREGIGTRARSTQVVTIAAAGDIACDPTNAFFRAGHGVGAWCRAAAVENVIRRIDPDAVIPLGDEQYDYGAYHAFRTSYGRSWGRERFRTYAVPGNHEYESSARRAAATSDTSGRMRAPAGAATTPSGSALGG